MSTVPEQFISNRPNSWTDWAMTLSSVIPRTLTSPTVSALPEVGADAPSPLGPINFKADTADRRPTLVAFVRHCGCPFAEKEVRRLAKQAEANSELRIVIVQHSSDEGTRDWFERIGGNQLFPDSSRVVLVSDVPRTLYAQWGIGQLGWTQMINGDIAQRLHKQKVREGLDLTKSDWTSYRWQNSGGFAVDREGKITWRKVATDSSDVCDWKEASESLVKGYA